MWWLQHKMKSALLKIWEKMNHESIFLDSLLFFLRCVTFYHRKSPVFTIYFLHSHRDASRKSKLWRILFISRCYFGDGQIIASSSPPVGNSPQWLFFFQRESSQNFLSSSLGIIYSNLPRFSLISLVLLTLHPEKSCWN